MRRQYYSALKKLLREAEAAVAAIILPEIPRLVAEQSELATMDSRQDAKGVNGLIDEVESKFKTIFGRDKLSTIARKVGTATSEAQKRELNNQFRGAMGIDVVRSEAWITAAVSEFTAENVALIGGMKSKMLNDLEVQLTKQLADGVRAEQISDTVKNILGVSDSKAKLIARDQVGKFNGDLNRVRQQKLGLDKYIWRTMGDERVRDEHEALNGTIIAWSDPPAEGNPGEPIQCRCYAEPYLDDLFAEE